MANHRTGCKRHNLCPDCRKTVVLQQKRQTAPSGRGLDGVPDDPGRRIPINGYAAPVIIMVDYEGGLSKRIGSLGAEIVVKNTVWTEYALADAGDYLLIGESTDADPIAAGADEVRQVIRYADTFERLADDFAILTGV